MIQRIQTVYLLLVMVFGARIEVTRGRTPIRLVRLHEAPFTDRLVAKFGLPVECWRGASQRRRRNGEL